MTDLTFPQASLALGPQDAWQMVLGQLQVELSRAIYETWVEPLRPLGYQSKLFTLGAANPFARDWVESRLKNRIVHLLQGLYNEPLAVEVVVHNGFYNRMQPAEPAAPPSRSTPRAAPPEGAEGGRADGAAMQRPGDAAGTEPPSRSTPAGEPSNPAAEAPQPETAPTAPPNSRKGMLQRAYGSRRAALIQPERGMFLTLYYFNRWLPLLGHSAATVVLAARSMCYWNPMTGELRNTVETEMGELATRAAVSLRTVKDVLANELVQRYFLRYRVRRMMTPNGVRTAGILLQVRMDDPLTPEDQAANNLPEEERWYTGEFGGEAA